MDNCQICCPVCTLYLREGITLEKHLETHPKDQVINALVKFTLGSTFNSENKSLQLVTPLLPISSEITSLGSNNITTIAYISDNNNEAAVLPSIFQSSNSETSSFQVVYKSSEEENSFRIIELDEQLTSENPLTSESNNPPSNEETNSENISKKQELESVASPSVCQELKLETRNKDSEPGADLSTFAPLPDENSQNSDISNSENSLIHIDHLKCSENISFIDITNNNSNLSLHGESQNADENNKQAQEPKIDSLPKTRNDFKNALKSHGIINSCQNSQDKSKDEVLSNENSNSSPKSILRSKYLNINSTPIIIDVAEDANIDPLDSSNNINSTPVTFSRFNDLNISHQNNDEYMTIDMVFKSQITKKISIQEVSNTSSSKNNLENLQSNSNNEQDSNTNITPKKSDEANDGEGETSYKNFSFGQDMCIEKEQENAQVNFEEVQKNHNESETLFTHDNWIQNYHPEGDDVFPSYDLLARESWGSSDLSDNESTIRIPTLSQNNITTINDSLLRDKILAKQKYKCNICNETFDCPKERRVHKSNHHKNGHNSKDEEEEEDKIKVNSSHFDDVFVKIDNENKVISETEIVKKEKRVVITVTPSLKQVHLCYLCGLKFSCKKLLLAHSKEAHAGSKFKCMLCLQVFTTELEYNKHLKIHPLECTLCGKFFYKRPNLRNHVRRHLGIKPYKCSYCDKTFATRQKVSEHTNTHTGNAPLKCTECGEAFKRYSNLIQHRKSKHMTEKKSPKDYICHCGEIFNTKKRLEWHKETHSPKPKYCLYCSERFIHAASLTRHIRKAHDKKYLPQQERKESEENVECSICYCIFIKSSLKTHMKIHEGIKPYSCNICAKVFSTKWNLQDHRWTHASRSSKPYKCNLCNGAFHRLSDYKNHMHSHKNFRPYTCNYCGCKFIRKYNCLRHVREHETEKSFACSICAKKFHRRYYLNEHMNIHSDVRPFTCHICGKASSTRSNHNKHVKIHHAREPVNTEG